MKKIAAFLLALVMVLALAACGAAKEEDTAAMSGENIDIGDLALRADGSAGKLMENDGCKLFVPLEYFELVQVDMPADRLFSVSEIASLEAAKAAGEPADSGAGWLFSVGRISEEELHEALCFDMSGMNVFARDADGNYYVLYQPTDVRLVRADNDAMNEAMEEWSLLNEWAASVPATFLEENTGLTAVTFGNSMLDMYLARVAYQEGADYVVSTTEFGELTPDAVDGRPFAEQLMTGSALSYEPADISETPDGEYLVLRFPGDDVRFDFFPFSEENYVRQVWAGGNEELFRAVVSGDAARPAAVMQEWYDALAVAHGLKGAAAEIAAADSTAPVEDDGYYSAFTAMPKADLEAYAAAMKQAYLDHDWVTIAANIRYPINMYPDVTVNNADEFLAYMEGKTAHVSDMEALSEETCRDMFYNGQGLCLGAGEIWMLDFNYMEDAEPDIAIIAVNGIVPEDEAGY